MTIAHTAAAKLQNRVYHACRLAFDLQATVVSKRWNMVCFVPDFEHLYQNEKFSDVEIEILEDCPGLGQKRTKGWMPAHSTVLMGFSNYCKVKLENWTTDASNTFNIGVRRSGSGPWLAKYSIQLPVPTGQKDVAARLIQGMYQKSPAFSDLGQQQLLHLLLLADKFEVPKVQAAALSVFEALSVDELHWDIALALLDLPFKSDKSAHKHVVATAEAKLLQQLGDLENAWSDKQLQNQLLQLPHAALLHLLQHDETRVASESTVVYTILQWWDKQPQSYKRSHMQQLKQLMQQVRMQHLTLLYISTCMMNNEIVLSCYSTRELVIACNCTDPRSRQALQDAKHPWLQHNPAWTAEKRPASNVQQVIEWTPSVAELRDAVEQALSTLQIQGLSSPVKIVQGQATQLKVELQIVAAAENGSNSGVGLQLGLFFGLPTMDLGNVRNVTYRLGIEAAVNAATRRPPKSIRRPPLTYGFRGNGRSRGFAAMVTFLSVESWSDVEAKLKQDQLVHADGCLHCKAEILEMA